MSRYKLVKQHEIKDCGVSCISMILSYYNGYINRDTLIDMTKTTKNGTTAYHIKNTLNNLGFKAKGVSCNFDDINKDNIILPCIASVIINNSYKHFIVIFEINYKKKYLIIGDPADKIKKISFDEFKKIFNNVLIFSFPIKAIPCEKSNSSIKFLLNIMKPHKKIIFKIYISSIFITLLAIITSFYYKYMIEGININSLKHLLLILNIFITTYILKMLLEFYRNILISYINEKIELSLTNNVFNKIIDLPYYYYHNKNSGDIISKINDLDCIKDIIGKIVLTTMIDLPLTILSAFILYSISKKLFSIGIIILILYLIIIIIFKEKFNSYIKDIKYKKSEYSSYIIDSINGFETIKGCNISNSIKNRFNNKFKSYCNKLYKFEHTYYIQFLLKDFIDNIGFVIIIFYGSYLALNKLIDIGTLITFSTLLTYFLTPIKNIINLDITIKDSKISINRILDLINYKSEDNGNIKELKNGDIVFKNVNFSFDDKKNILNNINLKIKEKSKVMVIGNSGSGKSTLFKLLMKYYSINDNSIFINNVDINNITNSTINNNIIYIGQNEILFNDTLYNNLIFDNSNKEELLEISKICFIDEILDKNLGYNMLIEENGFNLSGGQKQRIILARALLKKFDILIIDEGLNQVDIDMERKILKSLFSRYKDKTIIIISHRLDNLDLFDNLIKFENNKVYNITRNNK